jgi:L-asparagine transporter-like permease
MNIIVLTAVLSCLNSGVYVTARVLFAMADKGDRRWLVAVNKRHVPARAILLGSAFGFIVMLMKDVAPAKLFDFLMNSSGALMMFTYIFVVLAHFRFPYKDQALRGGAGTRLVAGGAAVAMLAVLIAMSFMPGKQPEMEASVACLVVIVVALFIKRIEQTSLTGFEEVDRAGELSGRGEFGRHQAHSASSSAPILTT